MTGRIGSVQQSRDGNSYGFIIDDEADRACVYLGFSTLAEADSAATQAQSLLVASRRCLRRKRGSCGVRCCLAGKRILKRGPQPAPAFLGTSVVVDRESVIRTRRD